MATNKAKKRTVEVGALARVKIQATFNNIIVTVTNMKGDVICWSSAGKMGFRGAKKSTPYAAQMVAKNCVDFAYKEGVRVLEGIYMKGIGPGREAAARAFGESMEIRKIADVTPIPHNGCRPPKMRTP